MRGNFWKASSVVAFILVLVLASISTQVQAGLLAQATAAASTMAATSAAGAATAADEGPYPPCPAVIPEPTAAATTSAAATSAAPATAPAAAAGTAAGPASAMKVEPFKTTTGCTLSTTLSGSNEVPKAGPSGAGGDVTVIISRPETGPGTICFILEHVHGITLPATAAHIHQGAVGVSGPVIVPLAAPDASGRANGCTTGVDRDLITKILTAPYNYYVNVHTTEFPAGAVRGQLQSLASQ
jgi:hypothetical protein